ncbi:MAG: alpha/beta hydrolase [Pseudomonadota bacterium]
MPDLQTDRLSISYRDTGPRHGKAVLLLHGWPDDSSTWDAVAEKLNVGGLRTVIPNLRGFGETRFLSETEMRTANSGVLAMDAVALMDGLGIETFSVAGHDWGSNIAEALAVGWPDRVDGIAMLSTPTQLGGSPVPAARHARPEWWSRWFHAGGRGANRVRKDRKGFAHAMWKNWSPPGWFDEETFDQVARSFENPDWVDVTLHAYRTRWGEASPDADSIWLEDMMRETRSLSLPALVFQGAEDGIIRPEATQRIADKFDGPFEYVLMPDVGHFPTREAPDMVGDMLTEHFGGC